MIIIISLICVLVRNREKRNEEAALEDLFIYYEMTSAEADDDFSENVIYAAGDVFMYRGKQIGEDLIQYEFVYESIWNEADAVNFSHAIAENAYVVKEKAQIIVGQSSGSLANWAFTLDNTSDESLEQPDYDGFYRVRIVDCMFPDDPEFIQLISSLEGIRKMEATETFMKISEENGIDWYEVWPELEGIEMF